MKLNKYFDHTNLKANATFCDIEKLCKEALQYDFYSVCVNPSRIEIAKNFLDNSDVKIATVIGFPLGALTTESKIFEARDAIAKGTDEIDMVVNIGKIKDRDFDYIEKEISSIKNAIGEHLLKVIIETALLDEKEIIEMTNIVIESGADYIKTSTGFSTRGVSLRDIEIIKAIAQNKIGIKASGGISTLELTKKLIKEGATRIGASKSVLIMKENQLDK
ncbi:MAG: deoxyribose-phosphate aldolase [Firmicutes bacterium]|nr:deoxyribose-phosphate aldolase [Bacillota bacterium]